jgi:hypothetical protein
MFEAVQFRKDHGKWKVLEAFVKSFVYFSKHSVCGAKVWKAIPERKSL